MSKKRGLSPISDTLHVIHGLFLFVTLLLLPGGAMSDDLLQAVKAYRQLHKQANIEITEIITRYIPNGCMEEFAVEVLRKNNFKIYRQSNAGEVTVIAVRKPDAIYGLGDELQVGFVIYDHKVNKVWAMLIYRAP